jgi:hypothetical protein
VSLTISGRMARQAIDIVPMEEVGPMDYKFIVAGRAYRIRFEQGAWILELRTNDNRQESIEVGSLSEGVNWALES